MFTETQIDLLQSSFALVRPIAGTAGMLFYERIFTLAPEARALFDDDLPRQAGRTMAAVGTVVDGLRDLDAVVPFLVRLGARHVRYGVKPEHFDVVGAALMWTLEQGLGDAFTPDVCDAWAVAWGVITETMLAGMAEEEGRWAGVLDRDPRLTLVPGRTLEIPVDVAAGETLSIAIGSREIGDSIAVLLEPDGTPVIGSDDAVKHHAAFELTIDAPATYRLQITSFEAVSIGELAVTRD